MTIAETYPPIHGSAISTIARLLAHERLMSIGVNRPDGWPQVTTVGYINDGLNLYFVTSRESQKLANLEADPRVSVSIHSNIEIGGAVGVSMAARAVEVRDPAEVERLNRMMFERWPMVSVYCPATSSIAIIQLKPLLICAISASAGRSKTECFSLGEAAAFPAAEVGPARLSGGPEVRAPCDVKPTGHLTAIDLIGFGNGAVAASQALPKPDDDASFGVPRLLVQRRGWRADRPSP